jgi:hypothetical protein
VCNYVELDENKKELHGTEPRQRWGSMCQPHPRHYALRWFRSAGVLSTPLRSPPRRRALHLLVFSTSSSSPPPHLLLHSGVVYSMSLSCHIRWCSLRRCPFPVAGVPCPRPPSPWGFLPCYPILIVGLCCAWPEFLDSSIRWPLRSARGERAVALLPSTPSPFLLCGSLRRRCISLVVVHFVGHYASIIFPRCCSPSCWLAVRYARIGLLSLLRVSLGKLLAITVVTTQAVGSGWGSKLLVGVKERE